MREKTIIFRKQYCNTIGKQYYRGYRAFEKKGKQLMYANVFSYS